MLEKQLEAQVRRYCVQKGVLFYKFTSPNRVGVPDRILVSPKGRVGFLELKRPGKTPEPIQLHQLGLLTKRHVPADWADNFPAAVLFINRLCAGGNRARDLL